MTSILSDSDFSTVSEVIASRTGLSFPRERWEMLGKNLVSASHEFRYDNTKVFVKWLLTSKLNKNQIQILASHLTISETYFWRDQDVFTTLINSVLPELISLKQRKEKNIKIWSAGCSTGEEPYSIAIALHKTIPGINDWNISIRATDINEKSLAKARKGVYNPWSFRNSPGWLKSMYFNQNQNRKYEIIPEIKKMVTFSCSNLAEDIPSSSMADSEGMDIIFCRNVLMYFSPEWAREIAGSLYRSLSKKGWLFVASCELSSQLFPKLTAVNFPGAIIYHKIPKDANSSSNKQFDNIFANYSQSKEPGISMPVETDYPSPTIALAKVDLKPSPAGLLPDNNVPEINKDSYSDKISAIRLLAGQGKHKEALSFCDKVLVSHKLVPQLYLLRASILQEMDKSTEAIRSLKKALYIDPDYIMGNFTLGNLFFRQGNMDNARIYFSNTLKLLNTRPDDVIPDEAEGLSTQYIREIIMSSINL